MPKFDSAWEKEYSQILFVAKRIGAIKSYVRCTRKGGEHTLVVRLSNGKPVKYTPDFWIEEKDGQITLLEIKGRTYQGREDRAGIKNFQHFSIHFPQYRFRMVTKKDGAWVTQYDLNTEEK
jgi:hypothetical protein